MVLTIDSTVTLRNGAKMPLLGFGVYQSRSALESCRHALLDKYRHIDSARIYRNEAEVIQAVKEWKASSAGTTEAVSTVFLTSKIASREHGTEKTTKAVTESIERAKDGGLSWDLFLLHDPTAGPEKRLESWKVLEGLAKEGHLKSIGVSNFSEVHLKQFKDAGVSTPAVNQIELHPWCQQKPIVEYCKREGIVVQAYCPIVRGERFNDPVLQRVASKVNKTPAQVLIRWSLQSGYVPLPKSDTPSRIAENANVYDFELDEQAMNELNALDLGDKGSCSWNPIRVP